MPTKTDDQVAQEWLYSRLSSLATEYQDSVPEGETSLAITAQFLTGRVMHRTFGGAYAWSEQQWLLQVSAVTEDYTNLWTLAALVQAALDNQSGTIPDGTIFSCLQSQQFRRPEVQPGLSIKSMGGIFTLCVKGT
jgi:hypothetical protein